jgi:hypothetical protein
LSGHTIPQPINANFVVGGLGNVTNFYIEALGGRKAAIMNKTVMGKSGHFTRMIMLLNTDTKLSEEENCNTITPLYIKIRSKEHLRRLEGRYYKLPVRLGANYTLMKGNETHLIEQDILLRSPITCNCKTGICHTCYGELSYINADINSIGAFAGAKITEPISQNILSTKHLLTTNSKMIKFKDSFYKFFIVNSNEITLNDNIADDINLTDYSLIMLLDNINTIDEFIENKEYNKYISIFHLKNNKTGELDGYMEEDMLDLYLSNEFNEMLNDLKIKTFDDEGHKGYEIRLDEFETNMPLFLVEIQNKELTKPLYDIMDLLNKDSHNGCKTIDDMAQTMLDLLIISKIDVMSVHGELIIKPLIRRFDDILRYPDWNTYGKRSTYQILTVIKSLTNHPSVTLSLSFQDLSRQLINPLTFRKSAPSFIDPFYKEKP